MSDSITVSRALLEELADDSECSFDHHGCCQTHYGDMVDGKCRNTRLRDVLAAPVPDPEQIVREQARGCCGDAAWRFKLCRYHAGMFDGMLGFDG